MLFKVAARPSLQAIALCFTLLSSTVQAQESAAHGSILISDLQLAVGAAISKAAYQKAPIEIPLRQLQKEVNELEGSLNSGQAIGSDALEENLRASTTALKAVRLKLSDPGSSQILGEIIEDVRLKNAATAETFKLFGTARVTPEVTVRINAIKDNKRQDGYSAILVPVGYGKEKAWKNGELDAIPPGASVSAKFTPEALAQVLPGVYWVHIFQTKLLATRLIKVMIDTKEIDVRLP